MKKSDSTGRYSYDKLSRVMHEKARLGIMTSLFAHPDGITFNDLKELCDLSDGNLSRHIKVLEDAGLVKVHKGYEQRRPKTDYKISKAGKKEFIEYLAELERVLNDAHAEALQEKKQSKKSSAKELGFKPT